MITSEDDARCSLHYSGEIDTRCGCSRVTTFPGKLIIYELEIHAVREIPHNSKRNAFNSCDSLNYRTALSYMQIKFILPCLLHLCNRLCSLFSFKKKICMLPWYTKNDSFKTRKDHQHCIISAWSYHSNPWYKRINIHNNIYH